MNINNTVSTLDYFNKHSGQVYLKVDQKNHQLFITFDKDQASSMKEISEFFKECMAEKQLSANHVKTMQKTLSVIKQNPPWSKTARLAIEGGQGEKESLEEAKEAKKLELLLTVKLNSIKILEAYLPSQKSFLKTLLLSDLNCTENDLVKRLMHLPLRDRLRAKELICKIASPQDAVQGTKELHRKNAQGQEVVVDTTPLYGEHYLELVQLLRTLKFSPKSEERAFSIFGETDRLGQKEAVETKKDRRVKAGTGVGALERTSLNELASKEAAPTLSQLVRATVTAIKEAAYQRDVKSQRIVKGLNADIENLKAFAAHLKEGLASETAELDIIREEVVGLENSMAGAARVLDDLDPESMKCNKERLREMLSFIDWLKADPAKNSKILQINSSITKMNELVTKANDILEGGGERSELAALGGQMHQLSKTIFQLSRTILEHELAKEMILPNLLSIKQAKEEKDVSNWFQYLSLLPAPEIEGLIEFPFTPPAIYFGDYVKENYIHDLLQNNLAKVIEAFQSETAKEIDIADAKTIFHAYLTDSLLTPLPDISQEEIEKAKDVLLLMRFAPSVFHDQMTFEQKVEAAKSLEESLIGWREQEPERKDKLEDQARLMMQHETFQNLDSSERRERNIRVNEWDRSTLQIMASQWLDSKETRENFISRYPREGSLLEEYVSGEWKEGEMRYLPDQNLTDHEAAFLMDRFDEFLLISPEYTALFDRFFRSEIDRT